MNETTTETIELKERHKTTWRDKPEWYWFISLLEEFIELGLSLIGLHKHKPELELSQIAAICLNWLEMRAEKEPTIKPLSRREALPWLLKFRLQQLKDRLYWRCGFCGRPKKLFRWYIGGHEDCPPF
jgi:hypothetical protein